ncbi:hypothetical protein D3C86_1969710 [compost metagenome]
MIDSGWFVSSIFVKRLNNGMSVECTGIINPTIKSPSTNDCSFHLIRVNANVTKLASRTVTPTDTNVIQTLLKK